VDFPLEGRVGGDYIRPENTAELEDSYRLLFGRTTIDLLHTDFASAEIDLDVDMAVGELTVIVPLSTAVVLDGSLEAGAFREMNHYQVGTGLQLDGRYGPEDAKQVVNLHVDGGIASLSIQRYRPYDPAREKRQALLERRREQRREERAAEERRRRKRADRQGDDKR
jgi:hypothetical protein